jgi:hypothetical protein
VILVYALTGYVPGAAPDEIDLWQIDACPARPFGLDVSMALDLARSTATGAELRLRASAGEAAVVRYDLPATR